MGADLYITKLIKNDKYDSNGEHYYRDSYNNSDLLWQYGLSWWADIKTDLTPTQAKALLKKLDRKQKLFNENMVKLITKLNPVFDYDFDKDYKEKTVYKPTLSDEERVEWVRYFVDKSIKFRKFLQTAIDVDSDIECSL